jgi:MFS family permease
VTRLRLVFAGTFQSLHVRNYRLYFFGQIASLTGTWMQSVGQVWLVLRLTGNGVDIGLVLALQFLPMLLAGPWGGVIADRVDKRRLLLATQSAAGMLALILGVLTVTGAVRLWMVFALATGLGLVNLVDNPARQSFVMEMVGKDDITNAVSLNSVVVNAARVVGPAVAGLLIAAVGIGLCFLLNALSYMAIIFGLAVMDTGALNRTAPVARRGGQLREGLRYVWSTAELRTPLLVMAVVGTLAYNFSVVFPLLVHATFGRGAQAYGTLFSLMGLGAVLGGLVIAQRNRATPAMLAGAAVGFGAMLWAAATVPSFHYEMLAVVPLGAASTAFIATSNSTLQLRSRPEMRGRVMALFSMVFLGSTPVGAPLIGWIAGRFGARAGLGVGATATLLAGLLAGWAVLRGRERRSARLPFRRRARAVAAGEAYCGTMIR